MTADIQLDPICQLAKVMQGANTTESYSCNRLYYYRARYYDPSAGRFLSEDRIRFEAGENFYRYVLNSPLIWNDPSGDKDQCFEVTPTGMREVPCAGAFSCTTVNGGYHCDVHGGRFPPLPPKSKYAPGCKCDSGRLSREGDKIVDEANHEIFRLIGINVPLASGGLRALEGGLEALGAKGAAKLVPWVEVGMSGYHLYELHGIYSETQKKLDKLYEGCI